MLHNLSLMTFSSEMKTTWTQNNQNAHKKFVIWYFFCAQQSHSQYIHNGYVDLFACNCFTFEFVFYHKRTGNKFLTKKQTVTSYYYICRINEQIILKSEFRLRYRITSQAVCGAVWLRLCIVHFIFIFFLFTSQNRLICGILIVCIWFLHWLICIEFVCTEMPYKKKCSTRSQS